MTNKLITIDSHQLRFENSIFRKEKIILNNEVISSRYSITGTKHTFRIENDKYSIISKYNMFDKTVIHLKVFKNNNFVKNQILELNFKQRLPWIIFGIISGVLIYKLIVILI